MFSFEASSTSPEALTHGSATPANWHLKKTEIAQTIESVMSPRSHVVRAGESVKDVAHALGVHVPPSLFSVREGDEWKFVGGSMLNMNTGTAFPVQEAANDGRFKKAA